MSTHNFFPSSSRDLGLFSAIRSSCIFGCIAKGGRFPHGAGLVLRPTIFVITHGDKHRLKFFTLSYLLQDIMAIKAKTSFWARYYCWHQKEGNTFDWEHSVTIGNHKCEEALIMTKLSHKFMAEENVTHLNSTSCTSVTATPTLLSNKLTKPPPIADWAFLASAPPPSWEKLTWICRKKNQNQCLLISHVITSPFG